MQTSENIYQSILHKISAIPPNHLLEVDAYLQKLVRQIEIEKEANKNKVLNLAGSWNDMEDEAFSEYLDKTKETSIFQNKDIEL